MSTSAFSHKIYNPITIPLLSILLLSIILASITIYIFLFRLSLGENKVIALPDIEEEGDDSDEYEGQVTVNFQFDTLIVIIRFFLILR